MKLKILLFLLTVLFNTTSLLACEETLQSIEETKIQSGQFKDGTCYLYLSPKNPVNLKYKAYLFQDDGQLMIFNSYGPGSPQKTTGSRLYKVLEEQESLNFMQRGDLLEIQIGANTIFEFSLKKVILSKSNHFQIQEKPLAPNNNGGVELFSPVIAFIDFGFKFGEIPTSEKERKFQYFNQGQRCIGPNKLLYFYKNGEIFPQFNSNIDIINALNKFCNVKYSYPID